jgi:hypothetical protein
VQGRISCDLADYKVNQHDIYSIQLKLQVFNNGMPVALSMDTCGDHREDKRL